MFSYLRKQGMATFINSIFINVFVDFNMPTFLLDSGDYLLITKALTIQFQNEKSNTIRATRHGRTDP